MVLLGDSSHLHRPSEKILHRTLSSSSVFTNSDNRLATTGTAAQAVVCLSLVLLACYSFLATFAWKRPGVNNASIVTDQSTHQIWPSEILQGTNYCVLTLRDAPLLSSFLWGWVEVLDTRLPQCKKKCFPLFFLGRGTTWERS